MQYECKITVLETKVFPELQEKYLAYSHFFRSKTCPNVTDLNCLISCEFFQKKKNAV